MHVQALGCKSFPVGCFARERLAIGIWFGHLEAIKASKMMIMQTGQLPFRRFRTGSAGRASS